MAKSPCSYYQLLGNLVFIKTVCKLDEMPFIPFERVEDIFYRVIKYGGQALVPILSPNEVGYVALKGKKFLVPIKDLCSTMVSLLALKQDSGSGLLCHT